jgi:tRNA pseudouridine32 synthase/23S rRNA pseudouridine746 synthase/23S rRNA pseudouridine1911/1915/1917 synthase
VGLVVGGCGWAERIKKPAAVAMTKRFSSNTRYLLKGLVILYEDRDILVVDKPAGLLTVATETDKLRTVHFALTDYIRKGCAKSRKQLFVVHRLDKQTSGVLIFAKTETAMLNLKNGWNKTEKEYLAVVHGRLEERSGTVTSYLTENKTSQVVYTTTDTTKGKLSHTTYQVLRETRRFSLLEVHPLTGRKNQIRVHLADLGHPVVGDRKYGKANERYDRMALHARSISFNHPFSGKRLFFEAEVPEYFNKLVGKTVDR